MRQIFRRRLGLSVAPVAKPGFPTVLERPLHKGVPSIFGRFKAVPFQKETRSFVEVIEVPGGLKIH